MLGRLGVVLAAVAWSVDCAAPQDPTQIVRVDSLRLYPSFDATATWTCAATQGAIVVAGDGCDWTAPTSPTSSSVKVIACSGGVCDTASGFLTAASVLNPVAFGPMSMPVDSLGRPQWAHYGTTLDLTTAAYVCAHLATVRANGGRVMLGVGRGPSKDANGNLSGKAVGDELARWAAKCGPAIASALADGTAVGIYLTDEPQCASCWGMATGASVATVDSMGMFAKRLWPGVKTFVRAAPSFWPTTGSKDRAIDYAWAQYLASKGTPQTWRDNNQAAAKTRGMGVVFGLNVLNGGNGSSGRIGSLTTAWQMSGAEVKSYGTVFLLAGSCTLINWQFSPAYDYSLPEPQLSTVKGFDYQADVRQAMDSLSRLAGRLTC